MPGNMRTLSGKSISQTLADAVNGGAAAVGVELYREGQGILAASVPLCPKDTGTLASSGYVTEPEQVGTMLTVEIGYGGPAAKINPKSGESSDSYAIYVHENLEAHHKVGIAKFLEIPFNAATAGMAERIAANAKYRKATAGLGDYVVGNAESAVETDYVF